MRDLSHIWERFEQLGGLFVSTPAEIANRLSVVEGLCFDWDGVFNDGRKSLGQGSLFSEADSMGINLLRYALWLKNGRLPHSYVITGENNRVAFQLAERECFDAVFFGVPDKVRALEKISQWHGLTFSQVAYIFDDVLDLSIADKAGLRLMVRRNASPLFTGYVINHSLVDYVSAHEGKDFAVREICELLIGLMEQYDTVVENRWRYTESYQQYLAVRNAVETKFFRYIEGHFKEVDEQAV